MIRFSPALFAARLAPLAGTPFCKVAAPGMTRTEVARRIANGEDPHVVAAIAQAITPSAR